MKASGSTEAALASTTDDQPQDGLAVLVLDATSTVRPLVTWA
jgi:hypothetical protein